MFPFLNFLSLRSTYNEEHISDVAFCVCYVTVAGLVLEDLQTGIYLSRTAALPLPILLCTSMIQDFDVVSRCMLLYP